MIPHVLLAIPYPAIDPVAIRIGPISIYWYALAYLTGLLVGWRYIFWLNRQPPMVMSREAVDDLLLWIILGVVLGGRIGYVLFYKPAFYFENPLQIFLLQRGGMSFHGGLLGVGIATAWFARRRAIRFLTLADLVATAAPIGLFLGRLANFVNGELYGRVTDVPWAMVFPGGGPLPRHPSQLYEATLEGLVAFILLFLLVRLTRIREWPGALSGVFLVWYALARIFVELFRQPDAYFPNHGFFLGGVTMGQILSLPVLAFGLWLIWRAFEGTRFTGRDETEGETAKPVR